MAQHGDNRLRTPPDRFQPGAPNEQETRNVLHASPGGHPKSQAARASHQGGRTSPRYPMRTTRPRRASLHRTERKRIADRRPPGDVGTGLPPALCTTRTTTCFQRGPPPTMTSHQGEPPAHGTSVQSDRVPARRSCRSELALDCRADQGVDKKALHRARQHPRGAPGRQRRGAGDRRVLDRRPGPLTVARGRGRHRHDRPRVDDLPRRTARRARPSSPMPMWLAP
jgi:hypothetical protein